MAYNKGLHEILSTRFWDIHPAAHQAYRQQIEQNMLGHVPFVMEADNFQMPFMLSAKSGFTEKVYVGNAERIGRWYDLDETDQIVNVIPVDGPITRNGGACSYGSREIRDMLKDTSEMPQVLGHIFVIDSPGGSAQSKYDFEQGIGYVREKGQKTIALVDGDACSAAYALASLCDEIYFVNANNVVGCIGTMCGFYVQKHGDVNAITQEKYVELYDEDSPFKNREFREAAEGNYAPLLEELHKSGKDFREMVKMRRPGVSEEQLKGDTYTAGEVVGSLVDGMSDFQTCVDRILETANLQRVEPLNQEPVEVPEEPEDEPDDSHKDIQEDIQNNQNQTEMKNYSKIQAALGLNALESDKHDALYLNAEQCEALENHLATCEQNADTLDAKMAEIGNLNATIEQMKSEHAEELTAAAESHEQAIEAVKAEHNEAMEVMKAEHASIIEAMKAEQEEAMAKLNEQVAELQGQLETANSSVAELEAEVKELSEKGEEPEVPEAPADNSVSAQVATDGRVCKPGMTAAERREALKKAWGKPSC